MFGWQILEIEEEYQLRPGLENIGRQVIVGGEFGDAFIIYILGKMIEANRRLQSNIDCTSCPLLSRLYIPPE